MLERGKTYLQIAFNRSFVEVERMISLLPASSRIIVEAGTPFVKRYGMRGVRALKTWWSLKVGEGSYVVADLKCMDRGSREVEMAARAGASAATCLGLAPPETINDFIVNCAEAGIHSMVDMLSVEFPFEVLKNLKELPKVVVLHRGVDEAEVSENPIPYHNIQKIKASYNILISLAGVETIKEVGRAVFNDADIAVVWRLFYEDPLKTAELAKSFLKEIR